jgi:nitrite reductase (NADH) small subunit
MRAITWVTGTLDVTPSHSIVEEVNGKTSQFVMWMTSARPWTIPVSIGAGPLGEGNLVGAVVTCPWHGWQFNVTIGACVANPSAKVERYEVQLEGTTVKVPLWTQMVGVESAF